MAVVGYPYGSLPLQIAVTRNDYGQSMVLSPSTCQMLQHCTLYTGTKWAASSKIAPHF